MKKRNIQCEHGQPMELKKRCDSGVARCRSQHQCHFCPLSETLLIGMYDNDIVYPDIIFCDVANVDHPPGIYSNSVYRLGR